MLQECTEWPNPRYRLRNMNCATSRICTRAFRLATSARKRIFAGGGVHHGARMRRLILAVTVALMPVATYAEPNALQELVDKQRKEEATSVDKDYQRLMKAQSNVPAAKRDPWGNVRNTDAAQPKQK